MKKSGNEREREMEKEKEREREKMMESFGRVKILETLKLSHASPHAGKQSKLIWTT